MARTTPGPVIREWWMRTLDEVVAPFVKDKGYDWEITIDETPFDLWSLHGELPPPFESVAEKRWVKENGSSPSRVGDFGLISYRVEHAGEDFEAQVLLVA